MRLGRQAFAVALLLSPPLSLVRVGSAAGAPLPPFSSSIAAVSTAQLGATWHRGCPVGAAALSSLRLDYVGFDGRSHVGTLVVATSVTAQVIKVFRTLYQDRFPIREMRPEAVFGGSDPSSMAADNTSSFNCRVAVSDGPKQWSVHAYGQAIDVDPLENPYVLNGVPEPAASRAYLDRAKVRPGMAVRGGTLVDAFASVGWFWGGRWSAAPDYQHFSKTGG